MISLFITLALIPILAFIALILKAINSVAIY